MIAKVATTVAVLSALIGIWSAIDEILTHTDTLVGAVVVALAESGTAAIMLRFAIKPD